MTLDEDIVDSAKTNVIRQNFGLTEISTEDQPAANGRKLPVSTELYWSSKCPFLAEAV